MARNASTEKFGQNGSPLFTTKSSPFHKCLIFVIKNPTSREALNNSGNVIPGLLQAEPGIQQPIEKAGFRITALRFPE
jgi:hypothetical protein